jgi:drug/metabolite transporter (DMT)-like permease
MPMPNPLRGIGLKVMSVAIFVAMFSCIKAAGPLPAGQIVFFRSFFAIFPILAVLAFRRELATAFHTARPLSHIVRGVVGVSAMGLGFVAVTRLPLPEAITLGYAQPLLGVVIISWPRLTLLTGGRGFDDGEAIGVVAALSAAAIAAVVVLLVRRLVTTERTATIVLWFSVTASVVGLATLPFGWSALNAGQAGLLVASGLCGGLGQILMTESYRHAEMATIAPFEYSSMILGIVVGYLLFGDVPTAHMLVGGVIVVSAGLLIIWREHRLGLERGRARKVTPP